MKRSVMAGLIAVTVMLSMPAHAQTASTVETTPAAVTATAPSDPNGCNEQVWDPDHRIKADQLTDAITSLTSRAVDVHVRVEVKTDGGADERIAQLEGTCPDFAKATSPTGSRPDCSP
jgi:predicted component of type VI protein secretion system